MDKKKEEKLKLSSKVSMVRKSAGVYGADIQMKESVVDGDWVDI
jgi:hypothetical protein